jgi:curved DNA-binding protein CbpA
MQFNYYEILGINSTATEEEIKAAYKKLAKKYHPDKNAGNLFYEEHFKKINSAYQTLSNKEKRQRYDLKIVYGLRRKSNPVQKPGGNQERRYTYRPTAKKPPVTFEKKKLYKYTTITVGGFVLFITATIFFFNYMNSITAKEQLAEGIEMEKKNQYMFAMQSYSSAIGYDKKLIEAYLRRADLRSRYLLDYEGALSDYSSAIKNNETEDAGLYFKRAKCYLKLKKYEEGLNDLDKASEISPKWDSLYFYKGEINNYILKKYADAIINYDKVLSLNKNSQDAWLGRALSKQNNHDYSGSIIDFDSLINLNPDQGSFYYYRAFSKIAMKDTVAACNDWFQAERMLFYEARELLNKYCH